MAASASDSALASAAADAATPTLGRTLLIAMVLALAVSLEYLFQPFIWRNWPVDEVLLRWLAIVRDRAWVAFVIAIAAWLALHAPRPLRPSLCLAAIILAALLAESALSWMGITGAAQDRLDLAMRVLRWSMLGLAVGVLGYLWRRALTADRLLRAAEQQQMPHTGSSRASGCRRCSRRSSRISCSTRSPRRAGSVTSTRGVAPLAGPPP